MRVLLILVVLLVNGCANWSRNSDSKLRSYDTYEQINYIEIASDAEITFSINEDNPTFDFEQGASYFYAIKLSGSNRQFLLRSFFSNPKDTRFASPVLLELDDEFKVVSKREPPLVFSETPRYKGPHMQGLISLHENTKYLIVYPSNDEQSPRTKTELISPQNTGNLARGVVLFPEYNETHQLTKTKTGKIELIPTKINS